MALSAVHVHNYLSGTSIDMPGARRRVIAWSPTCLKVSISIPSHISLPPDYRIAHCGGY